MNKWSKANWFLSVWESRIREGKIYPTGRDAPPAGQRQTLQILESSSALVQYWFFFIVFYSHFLFCLILDLKDLIMSSQVALLSFQPFRAGTVNSTRLYTVKPEIYPNLSIIFLTSCFFSSNRFNTKQMFVCFYFFYQSATFWVFCCLCPNCILNVNECIFTKTKKNPNKV